MFSICTFVVVIVVVVVVEVVEVVVVAHVYMCIYTWIYVYTSLYLCLSLSLYIYIRRERQMDRYRERESFFYCLLACANVNYMAYCLLHTPEIVVLAKVAAHNGMPSGVVLLIELLRNAQYCMLTNIIKY